MSRTILIDADILAFQIASTQEAEYTFGTQSVLHADLEAGVAEIDKAIVWIIEHTDSDQAALFLTGPDNFRKKVLASYKANRKDVRRPMILGGLRDHLIQTYKLCFIEPTLEGDDLIGIHATKPHKGERVVYSSDKDLKQVPGLHWCKEDGQVVEISEEDGDASFFTQIITGDPTDNYAGCPGAGPVLADNLLTNRLMFVQTTRTLKSGPNKGQERVEWKLEPSDSPWASVVSAYEKAGLTEKDAVVQARCARILRHGEYNFEKQRVKLWKPS